MAEPVPGPAGFAGPHFPHDWDPWDNYQTVHLSRMDRLERAGVILRQRISFVVVDDELTGEPTEIHVHGQVEGAGGVRIHIDKRLEVRRRADGRLEVRGRLYAYHAWRGSTREGRDLLRYDSSPAEPLHRHEFDPATGSELAKTPIDLTELPNLDQFIEMAVALGGTAGA